MGSVGASTDSREKLGKWQRGGKWREVFGRCCDSSLWSETRLPASFPLVITVSSRFLSHSLCRLFREDKLSPVSLGLPACLYSRGRKCGSWSRWFTLAKKAVLQGWCWPELTTCLRRPVLQFAQMFGCINGHAIKQWYRGVREACRHCYAFSSLFEQYEKCGSAICYETVSPWKGFFGPFVVTVPYQATTP